MTLLHFALNLLFAVLAYLAVSYLLKKLGVEDVLNVLTAFLVGLGVFVANFAKRLRA